MKNIYKNGNILKDGVNIVIVDISNDDDDRFRAKHLGSPIHSLFYKSDTWRDVTEEATILLNKLNNL